MLLDKNINKNKNQIINLLDLSYTIITIVK